MYSIIPIWLKTLVWKNTYTNQWIYMYVSHDKICLFFLNLSTNLISVSICWQHSSLNRHLYNLFQVGCSLLAAPRLVARGRHMYHTMAICLSLRQHTDSAQLTTSHGLIDRTMCPVHHIIQFATLTKDVSIFSHAHKLTQ